VLPLVAQILEVFIRPDFGHNVELFQ